MFYPYEYVKSVFDIDYDKLYSLGYRGLIFDIDNTLVHHGENSTPQIDELFRQIHITGFKTLLLSNNNKERIERFLTNIDSFYISDADKPKTSNYDKAVKMLNIKKDEAVFIGDQIFTDIYGANRYGIASILVDFLHYENETKYGKKRALESVVLKFYKHNRKYRNRLGNICKGEKYKKYVMETR